MGVKHKKTYNFQIKRRRKIGKEGEYKEGGAVVTGLL